MHRRPGAFRFLGGEHRTGDAMGWADFDLDSTTSTLHFASVPGVHPAVALARQLRCEHVERAAAACPLVLVKDPGDWLARGERLFTFRWNAASNSAEVTDSKTQRHFLGDLSTYQLAPMLDSERAVTFLTQEWAMSADERHAAAEALTRGISGSDLIDLELDEALGPSLDRIIRHVSNGDFNADLLQLSVVLHQLTDSLGWFARTFFRNQLELVAWNRTLATELAAPAPDEAQWGQRLRVLVPEVIFTETSRLRPEERVFFEHPPDEHDFGV